MLKINTKKDELGNQFVKYAITGELHELPKIISDPDFDPNVKDELGETITHSILRLSLADVGVRNVETIIKALTMLMHHPMYNIDEPDQSLETPLMLIAKYKELNNFAKLFIDGEIEPDFSARDYRGDTIEDIALRSGNNEVLVMLLNSPKTKKTYLKGMPVNVETKSCAAN